MTPSHVIRLLALFALLAPWVGAQPYRSVVERNRIAGAGGGGGGSTAAAAPKNLDSRFQTHYAAVVGGNTTLSNAYALLDRNRDFRLDAVELVMTSSNADINSDVHPDVLQVLRAYEEATREFERGICQPIPLGFRLPDDNSINNNNNNNNNNNTKDGCRVETGSVGGTQSDGGTWRDERDLKARETELRKYIGCTTTRAVVSKAISHLQNHTMLHPINWVLDTKVLDARGTPRTAHMPIVVHIARLYNELRFHELRDLIIRLLHSGVDVNTATPNMAVVPPIVFTLLQSFPLDGLLASALLQSRPRLQPVLVDNRNQNQNQHERARVGFSALHLLFERVFSVISKHILQVRWCTMVRAATFVMPWN